VKSRDQSIVISGDTTHTTPSTLFYTTAQCTAHRTTAQHKLNHLKSPSSTICWLLHISNATLLLSRGFIALPTVHHYSLFLFFFTGIQPLSGHVNQIISFNVSPSSYSPLPYSPHCDCDYPTGDACSGKSRTFEHVVDYLLRQNMNDISERNGTGTGIGTGIGTGTGEMGTEAGSGGGSGSGGEYGMTIRSPVLQQTLNLCNTKIEQSKFNFEGSDFGKIRNSDYEFGHNFLSKMESAKILLDAFGTAKTVNNVNASRYGKFLNLYYKSKIIDKRYSKSCIDDKFDFKQYILGERTGDGGGGGGGERVGQDLVGGQYSIYMLQAHTVTERNRGTGNPNFNVFYSLVSGLRTFHSGKLGTWRFDVM
jgi:hypothetical protein